MRKLPDTGFACAPNVRCVEHGQLWQQGRLEKIDGRYFIRLVFCCGCEETAEIIKGNYDPTYQQKSLLPVR